MNKKLLKTLATATLLLATAGCAVGPNYKRPLVEVPTNFRAEPASSSASGANTGETAAILGDEQWVEIFEDASLQQFVRKALRNNLDLRTAAQRVLEAQAQVGITRSQQLPSVNGARVIRHCRFLPRWPARTAMAAPRIPSSMEGD